jgi:hypothetical protein
MRFINIRMNLNQYRDLLRLVYLGDWMANAIKESPPYLFEEVEQHILSYAKEAGMDGLVVFDHESKKYYQTADFDQEMQEIIEDYEDYIFWEELASRLAERDLVDEIGEEAIEKMDVLEIVKAKEPFLVKYYQEFEKNGLENIYIVNSD